MSDTGKKKLAQDGGTPVRTEPVPGRSLFGAEERQAVNQLFDEAAQRGHSVFGYGGAQEQAYTQEFADYLGGGYADGVNSGTNALYVALRSLELEPGSEVIVPAVSDAGGVMPVAIAQCIPVPADGSPNSFNIGPAEIEARLSKRTRAVVVAHIAGIPADMDAIMDLARAHDLRVIEDCAQAHGALHRGRFAGTLGDVAAFSTMFGKQHATGGQGGMVFTRDEEHALKIRRYADRGKPIGLTNTGGNVVASLNCNMDEIHAAIGRAQLRKLPAMLQQRRSLAVRIAAGCRERLQTVRAIGGLPGDDPAPWFLFFDLDAGRLTVDKAGFVEALKAELPGFPLEAGYGFFPTEMPWYHPAALAALGLPRERCLEAGDARRALPNIQATNARWFRSLLHEGWRNQDAEDLITALEKVECAYLK